MRRQIKNEILELRLQWNCYRIIKTGSKIQKLETERRNVSNQSINTLKNRLNILNEKIDKIDSLFV